MLSHTGLKHYFKTDKKVFNELIRRYCPAEYIQSEYVLLIEKTAHAIRCKKTNREVKQKKLYPKTGINTDCLNRNDFLGVSTRV